jgi:Tat protein translocase TatB subunit
MLDIGFSELLVIGGVALVVLGPEKLAVVARTAGKWTGKAQRYVNDVKADIAREGELAELRKLKEEMEATGRDVGASLRTTASDVQQDLSALESTVSQGLNPPTPESTSNIDPFAGPLKPGELSAKITTDLTSEQAEANIQASLDSASHYTPPAIDMTGRYQSGLDSTLSPPPLNDPIALRMELESLQEDFTRLENRMDELKRSLAQANQAGNQASA